MPSLPRYKTRAQIFDDSLLKAYNRIVRHFPEQLAQLDLAVDIVPRFQGPTPSIWPEDIITDSNVPLGRLIDAGVDHRGTPTRPRIIIFRQPIEMRSESPEEIEQWLRQILAQLVALYLNVTVEHVDPSIDWD